MVIKMVLTKAKFLPWLALSFNCREFVGHISFLLSDMCILEFNDGVCISVSSHCSELLDSRLHSEAMRK